MLNDRLTGGLHEACGVFGIYGHPNACELVYYGLHALQHRGQESAGIVAVDRGKFNVHKGMGLVTHVFENGEEFDLTGEVAAGHVMYGFGNPTITEAQPLVLSTVPARLRLPITACWLTPARSALL